MIKRLFNDGYDIVEEMLEGYVKAHDDVKLSETSERVLVKKELSEEPKVGIVIGGGSGHEPLFLGYVGDGFADAAVIGNINTSPAPDAALDSVKQVDQGKGVLFLYGNYQGDVLNFDMAAELAEDEGIRVETVTITDDVYSSDVVEERRGVAGDIIVMKAAAAAAEAGLDLDQVKAVAEEVNRNTWSLGVALSSSTLPVTGKEIFELEDGKMEIGMGIHGEPGIRRDDIDTADNVTTELMGYILDDSKLQKGDEVVLLVNGLGGLPVMDLYVVNRKVHEILEDKGIKVHDNLVGNYATSMDMVGMSITLTKVDEDTKKYYDAPAKTPYFNK